MCECVVVWGDRGDGGNGAKFRYLYEINGGLCVLR